MPEAIRQSPSEVAHRIFIYGVLLLFAVYFLVPFFVMFITSIKTMDEIRTGTLIALPRQPTLEPWLKAWGYATIGVTNEGIQGFFWNSIRMVIPAVLISTFIGALNGYVLSKWRFKGSDTFFAMLLLGCFIPFQVILLPMARTLGFLGLSESMWGLVLVHTVYGLAFTTLFFRNYYVAVPSELVNAARIDGAGFFRIFWRIMLPISIPIFMVTIIWQTTQIWNDFLFGVCFSTGETQPITVALNNLVNTSSAVKEYNVDMAAAIIAALPTLFVYFVAGKYFVRGLTAGAVKG
ncbi:MAG: carbohydrate ABC transporter permease [Desulfobacterales bacterium]|nr:carbohydrate ABC transporter permease [Desulfobacterales bacterium]MDJ0876482.1 carbohydrate ABC transporter permease [Desulfobacterales bacterium]MDJ0885209.1 carbohydrate ABC transporter permease [Desulfobacterales bacterium]